MSALRFVVVVACVAGCHTSQPPSSAVTRDRATSNSNLAVPAAAPITSPRAFVAPNGSLVLVDEHDSVRLELSAPLVPCSVQRTKPADANRSSPDQRALRSLLSFGYLLKTCAPNFPAIALPSQQGTITAKQAEINHAAVAQCVMQDFYAKPYFSLEMIEGSDVCLGVLGRSWRMPTESDARFLTVKDREALDRLLPPPEKAMGGYDSLTTYARARDNELLLVTFGLREVGVVSLTNQPPEQVLQRHVAMRCVRTSSTAEARSNLDDVTPSAADCGKEMMREVREAAERRASPEGVPTLSWIARLEDLSDEVTATPSEFDARRVERECDRALPLARPFNAAFNQADLQRGSALFDLFTRGAATRLKDMPEGEREQLKQKMSSTPFEQANLDNHEHLRRAANNLGRVATERFHAACAPVGTPYTAPDGANIECDSLLRLMPKLQELAGIRSMQVLPSERENRSQRR